MNQRMKMKNIMKLINQNENEFQNGNWNAMSHPKKHVMGNDAWPWEGLVSNFYHRTEVL